jgi:hypothetical protein
MSIRMCVVSEPRMAADTSSNVEGTFNSKIPELNFFRTGHKVEDRISNHTSF